MNTRLYVKYQYLKVEDGYNRGYRTDGIYVASEEEGWALVQKMRRYLTSEKRAAVWAERQGLEGYLVAVMGVYRELIDDKVPPPSDFPEWKEPAWIKELP